MKRLFHIFSAITLLLAACGNTFGQAGSLDANFGDGGYVKTYIGSYGKFNALLLQPDDKIVAIGTQGSTDSKVVRYHSDGTLDESFGSNGLVTLNFKPCDAGGAGALLPDGKMLVAVAEMEPFCNQLAPKIARLHSDGSLDETFGTAGFVDLSSLGGLESFSNQLLIYPSGAFVFFGTPTNTFGTPSSIFVAKFNADGSPFNSFGQNGVLTIPTDFAHVTKVQATFHYYGRLLIGASGWADNHSITLFRVNEFGTLDGSFGTAGKVQVAFPTDTELGGVATLPDGSILTGASTGYGSNDFVFVAKHLANGIPDESFSIDGIGKIGFSENCHATGLALQPDGKILVGGMAGSGDHEDYFLTRFLANGSIDNTFGAGGVAKHLDPAADHCSTSLQIQPDGKLLLAGFTVQGKASMARFQLENALGTNPATEPVSNLLLSPNPSSDLVELRFSLDAGDLTRMVLSDLAGQTIWQAEEILPAGEHREMLALPNLPSGLYFVKISTDNGSLMEKMIRN